MRIVVVGAGPAGIAAAATAAEGGASVCLVDENPRAGGQIWRHRAGSAPPKAAGRWLRRLGGQRVETRFGATALGSQDGKLLILGGDQVISALPYDRLILATGARELFLPFPGWTLPDAMGCGGAQAFLKTGMPVRGRRVVVAGSGPLLMAVAAAYAEKGAHVVGIVEQAGFAKVMGFAAGLFRYPSKALQGAALAWKCLPALTQYGAWIKRALGGDAVQAVVATDGTREWRWECDLLACGFGLVPNTELAVSLGCRIESGKVAVDARQRTSRPDIYCAGEGTGIGGEDVALLEGEIAALSASASLSGAPADAALEGKIRARARWNAFLLDLDRAFRLRPEVLRLAEDDTVVCRCEDVAYGALKTLGDQRTAKLYTRCGMGPCQGRVCGAACHTLFGWQPNRTRWPLAPVEMRAMADMSTNPSP